MVKNKYTRIATLLLLFLFISQIQAQITATLDRKTVRVEETLTLTLKSNKPVAFTPDLSQFSEKIQVLSQMQFSNKRNIQGKRTYESGWKIQLMALEPGIVTIPSIELGSESTKPIQLTILPSSNANKDALKPFYLETEFEQENPFIQQQNILTIKVFSNADIENAQIEPPTIDNTLVRSMGPVTEYVTRLQGTLYRVWDFKFALFAQTNDDLQIPPFVFKGNKIVRYRSRSPFSLLNSQTRIVKLETKPFTLKIKPAVDLTSTWLPAKNLTIDSYWRPQLEELTVGEPITRVIEIKAQGLDAAQLPEIEMVNNEGISWFPNPAIRNNEIEDDNITGSVLQRIALIPNKSGSYQLPAIKIRWWDLEENKFKTAVINPMNFKVKGEVVDPNALNNQTALLPLNQTSTRQSISNQPFQTVSEPSYWKITAIITTIFWLLTLLLWWAKLKSNKGAVHATNDDIQPTKTLCGTSWKTVSKQIKGVTPKVAYRIIRNNIDSDPNGFDGLIEKLKLKQETQLIHLLEELSQFAYASNELKQINPDLPQQIEKLDVLLASNTEDSSGSRIASLYS